MNKKQLWHVLYFIAALIGIIVLQQLWAANQQIQVIPYSQFLDNLRSGKVLQVKVAGDYLEGKWKEPVNGKTSFVTNRVPPDLASELSKHNVQFSGVAQNTFLGTLLSWVVPTLLFFGIWAFWFRRVADKQGLAA